MRNLRVSVPLLLAIVLLCLTGAAAAATGFVPSPHHPSDAYIVQFHGDGIPTGFNEAVAAAGGRVREAFPEFGMAVVDRIDAVGAGALEAANGVKSVVQDLEVQWVPDTVLQGFQVASGPSTAPQAAALPPQGAFFYPYQWNMRQVQADRAWDAGFLGDPSVTVAVLDSGIDSNHIDMRGKVDLARSRSFIPSEPFIDDLFWHGTFVAGIISTNNLGTAGVAPKVKLVAVKVLAQNGFGSFAGIIAGIRYATDLKVDVINMSIVAYFPKNIPGIGALVGAIAKAVNYASTNGVMVVVSAGNLGINLDKDANFLETPAQSGNAFSVSATGPFNQMNFDRLASYSNYGRSGADVAAPGGEDGDLTGNFIDGIVSLCASTSLVFPICQTSPNFYLFGGTGTSFAAPIASGTAALVDSIAGGSLNGGQLKSILQRSADDLGAPGVDLYYSHGRVNTLGAVQSAPNP